MKSEDYTIFMNYLSIINERFNTLKLGVFTTGINANDNLYINYPNDLFTEPFVITGITTILDTEPAVENLTEGALYVAGGVHINKNLFTNWDITNKNEEMNLLSRSHNVNSEKICVNEDFYTNNIYFENLNCANIELNNFENNFIISDEIIINSTANIIIEPNTGAILNEKFLIGNLIVFNNSDIDVIGNSTVGNISGNFDITGSNITTIDIFGEYINTNNLLSYTDMLIHKNLNANNTYINGIFKFNKKTAYSIINNFNLSRMLLQKNPDEIYTGNTVFDKQLTVNDVNMINNNDIFCNEIFVKFSIETEIRNDPLCIDQSILEITNMNFFFQAIEIYCSFNLTSDIVFENPSSNFNMLTYYFDLYSSDLVTFKPKYGFYILVGGFRSSVTITHFVIYRINFFDLNSSQINISIHYDSNNELNFVLGFVYTIFKFNCNYLI
jgi:hypothetical protein